MALVVVRINKTYRASVYDLADLKRYISEYPKDVDKSLLAVEDREDYLDTEKWKNLVATPAYLQLKKACQDYVKSLLIGYTFEKWSEVKERVKKERRDVERGYRDGVIKFHYHGLVLCVNDERIGDDNQDITLRALKTMVEEAELDYPNSRIEISLEGHYDWWESYQSLFAGDPYEPTDFYIDIPLYKNFVK